MSLRSLGSSGFRSASVAVGVLFMAACSSILGIEDLKAGDGDGKGDGGLDGGPGDDGSGGSRTGTGGKGSLGGGSVGGGSDAGGSGDGAGGTNGGGGSDTSDDGGSAGGTSNVDGGEGGADGGTIPTGVIKGRVIDLWQRPVVDAAITINGQDTATDANGKFTVEGVTGTYDVIAKITANVNYTQQETFVWVYRGLTRNDPTIQVYQGSSLVYGDLSPHVKPATLFPLPDTDRIVTALGSPDGEWTYDLNYADYGSPLTVAWYGPSSIAGTIHALRFQVSGTKDLPSKYWAYDSHPVAVNDSDTADVSFDLTTATGAGITTGAISGTVAAGSATSRENKVYLRFASGASIPLLDESAPANAFTYVVPTVSGGTLTVAASNGDYYYVPYQVAYQTKVLPGTNNLSFTLPTPASNVSVNSAGLAKWTSTAKTFLLHIQADQYFEDYYVLTSAKQAAFPPESETGLAMPKGRDYTYVVETHGTYDSVDAAAGPTGFLQSFRYGEPEGVLRDSGAYTESAAAGFTSPP